MSCIMKCDKQSKILGLPWTKMKEVVQRFLFIGIKPSFFEKPQKAPPMIDRTTPQAINLINRAFFA